MSRGASVVTASALALVAVGALGAFRVHAAAFGPTHPESRLRPLPVTAVRWAWAGAVSDTGFRVVAKVAHDGEARLLVGNNPTLAAAVVTSVRRASHDDNDRVVTFAASSLSPGQHYYYYGIESGGTIDRARTGHVRTTPRQPFSFTIAVGGCARVGSNGAVYDAIRRQNPFLYLVAGDFYYANIDEDDREAFENEYDLALTRPRRRRSTGRCRSTTSGTTTTSAPTEPTRPHRAARRPSRAIGRSRRITRCPTRPASTTRSWSDACASWSQTRDRRVPTMLGARQKAWLKRELLLAQRKNQLAVWVSSVPWIASEGADSWAGYPHERRELADFVERSRIVNLLMVAGDAHMVAIDDGTNKSLCNARWSRFSSAARRSARPSRRRQGRPLQRGRILGQRPVRDDHGS